MLLIVHQCFLKMLSRKIIVRTATLQTTKVFLLNIIIIIVFVILGKLLCCSCGAETSSLPFHFIDQAGYLFSSSFLQFHTFSGVQHPFCLEVHTYTPSMVLKSKYKPIVSALKNYNLNSREKFEPGPGFEPRTSRSLAWRQIPVQVRIFLLNSRHKRWVCIYLSI